MLLKPFTNNVCLFPKKYPPDMLPPLVALHSLYNDQNAAIREPVFDPSAGHRPENNTNLGVPDCHP